MAAIKIYKCCICHKVLEDYKPIRLTEQHYGIGQYKQYYPTCNYDLCKECYLKFSNWIKKNNT